MTFPSRILLFDGIATFANFIDLPQYRGINKSLRWTALEDLRIHRINLFISQKEMNR
jgi:hypothetical protein